MSQKQTFPHRIVLAVDTFRGKRGIKPPGLEAKYSGHGHRMAFVCSHISGRVQNENGIADEKTRRIYDVDEVTGSVQDHGLPLPQQTTKTPVTKKTRLCHTQCGMNRIEYGTSLVLKRLDFCHTPKHGTWLNKAENELTVLARQCV